MVITRKLEQIAPASDLPRDLRTCELQSINQTVYDPETGKFLGLQETLDFVNVTPNRTTGYSAFFLNYGYREGNRSLE